MELNFFGNDHNVQRDVKLHTKLYVNIIVWVMSATLIHVLLEQMNYHRRFSTLLTNPHLISCLTRRKITSLNNSDRPD